MSYEACRRALDYARSRGDVSTVDLTNFSEAARSLFRFDEAESTLLEATRSRVSWYGNPWVDLADLYVRQGRFAEAGDALQGVCRIVSAALLMCRTRIEVKGVAQSQPFG